MGRFEAAEPILGILVLRTDSHGEVNGGDAVVYATSTKHGAPPDLFAYDNVDGSKVRV